jgi:hypothetical protein
LVVGDDFNAVVLPHGDARVGGSEINADSYMIVIIKYWLVIKVFHQYHISTTRDSTLCERVGSGRRAPKDKEQKRSPDISMHVLCVHKGDCLVQLFQGVRKKNDGERRR